MYTLQKETGKKITSLSTSSNIESINGYRTTSNKNLNISNTNSISRENEGGIRNFVVNCYVKLETYTTKKLQAVISYSYDGETYMDNVVFVFTDSLSRQR